MSLVFGAFLFSYHPPSAGFGGGVGEEYRLVVENCTVDASIF